jgi:hypothetical protein
MKKMYLLMFLLIPALGISQTTSISGVVTYFFNDYQGNKPDIGAKVYIINALTNPALNFGVVDSFITARKCRGLYIGFLEIFSKWDELQKQYEGDKNYQDNYELAKASADKSKEYIDQYYAEMVKYGVETDEKFAALDKRTFSSLLKINDDNSILRTVDGVGNYSVNVKPGTYYVYIVSKNRSNSNWSETFGKIYYQRVIIKENQTKDVSYNFDQY